MGGMKGFLMVRYGEPNRPRGIQEVGTGAQTTYLMRASERFAERVAPVAQTTHPSQAGLAMVLNSLVVPPFLRRGSWRCVAYCLACVFFGGCIYFA